MKIYSLVAAALIVGCVIIVPIFVFAIANYEATPARGVSTVADVVAYQKKAEETLAQIYRYCDHAVEVEERENGDLGYFGRTAFKGKCQRRMLGLDNASNGGAPSESPGPNWGVLNLQQCYRLGALAWSALFFYASHPMVEAPTYSNPKYTNCDRSRASRCALGHVTHKSRLVSSG